MCEIWKDIAGYEGLYQVSNLGNVRGLTFRNNQVEGREKIHPISKTDNGYGYHIVSLRKYGKRKNFYVHRIVAAAFIEKPEGKDCINHLDYDKHNNRVDNLEWCTQLENTRYSVSRMRRPKKKEGQTNTGEKYIRFRKGNYNVGFPQLKRYKAFPTLEEAIKYRDSAIKEYYG